MGTDHHIIRFKIRIHLKGWRKNANQRKISVDSIKLKDNKLPAAFQKDLHNVFNTSNNIEMNLDKKYELFSSQI